MKPVLCDSCEAEFTAAELPDTEARMLESQCRLESFLTERKELYRIHTYFQRHPEAENTLARLGYLERQSLFDKLPHETEEDAEAVEYLQGHQFSLKARLAFVEKEIKERKNEVRSVACPACAIGELFVRAEFTESFFVGEELTFYWLPSMSLQEDGKIWMKVSGYRGEEHWSGAHAVLREQADYDFWLWLLSHKEHNPELIDEKQLEEIKSDWQRARE